MTTPITESKTVQAPMIEYASQIGWQPVSRQDAESLRGGTQGIIFSSILTDKLLSLNPDILNPETVREVVRNIENVHHDIRGNNEALEWLRGNKSVYLDTEKRERNIRVIDYENPQNNTFQVTDEWTVTSDKPHRADVVFLINGIPVAVAETKSPKKRNAIYEGLIQIRQYHRETPAMFALPQVFEITNLPEFHYGATWNTEAKNLFDWREEREGNFEAKVKSFFDTERFLKLIEKWVIFYLKDDELRKTVLRQHQTRAAERIEERCADTKKTRGLIWHTQGSGKTFTMIKAAELVIRRKTELGDPTVILMIDRNELEGQLEGWLASLSSGGGIRGVNIRRAQTKKDLREILESDFRGLVISTIQKFDDMPANMNDRKNIFVFIDEAHRGVEGDLGNYLTGALPYATLIGFTGTPVDKTAHGRGTFKVFGKEDKTGYLDKYSIMESIRDGTTVGLKYKLAPAKLTVPAETLEKEFLGLAEAEGLCDIEQLNRVLEKAVTLKNFLKAGQRVRRVAEFAARHFKENVEPLGYKAFFVAVDREACALYKREFDKHLPPESVKAVYTKAQHDTEALPLVAQYQIPADEEKTLRKEFQKPGRDPKMFVVTDKLLTGFDAPVLYCMYLDKPMRDHVLLQSIARVNRPHTFGEGGKEKEYGLIVDFIGIFGNMKKALAFDSKDVSGVIEDIEILFEKFGREMERARGYLKETGGGKGEKIIERFTDKAEREAFIEFFRGLQGLYEILSPDEKLRGFLDDYTAICGVYKVVMKSFERDNLPVRYGEFLEKTEKLIADSVGAFGPEENGAEAVVSAETLEEILQSGKSDKVKINNLLKLVEKLVSEIERTLGLASMAGKARDVRDRFHTGQAGARETVENLNRIARENLGLRREFEESGMSAREFVFRLVLEKEGDANAGETAAEMENLFSAFPDHRENMHQKMSLKSGLYKLTGAAVGEKNEDRVIGEIMKLDERIKKEVQG
ncbi:MAG: HsdR family type I site-specific deoxyribonuclease [Candidatus Dadabacteria bacterium]|nr:HsdR family type I site-specific deoxyribonuclease [Candidatus Dadabacteria bacterium]